MRRGRGQGETAAAPKGPAGQAGGTGKGMDTAGEPGLVTATRDAPRTRGVGAPRSLALTAYSRMRFSLSSLGYSMLLLRDRGGQGSVLELVLRPPHTHTCFPDLTIPGRTGYPRSQVRRSRPRP